MTTSYSVNTLVLNYVPQIEEAEVGGYFFHDECGEYLFGPMSSLELAESEMVIYYNRLCESALAPLN